MKFEKDPEQIIKQTDWDTDRDRNYDCELEVIDVEEN